MPREAPRTVTGNAWGSSAYRLLDRATSLRDDGKVQDASRPLVTRTSIICTFVCRVCLEIVRMMVEGLWSDPPACQSCGAITVRSGFCYRCMNCRSATGCG